MIQDGKLLLIENVLKVEPNTLSINTELTDVPEWDSLNILNLLIELSVMRPDLLFEDLYECKTVGELCDLFP